MKKEKPRTKRLQSKTTFALTIPQLNKKKKKKKGKKNYKATFNNPLTAKR